MRQILAITKLCMTVGTNRIYQQKRKLKDLPLLRLLNKHHYLFSNYKRPPSISERLQQHNMEYNDHSTHIKVKYCPFCPKPHNQQRTNLHTLNIQKQNGLYNCFRCSAHGNWPQFQARVFGNQVKSADFTLNQTFNYSREEENHHQKMAEAEYFIYSNNLQKPQFRPVLDYLIERGFKTSVIRDFNIGAGYQKFSDQNGKFIDISCVFFPFYKQKMLHQIKQKVDLEQGGIQSSNFVHFNNWTELVKAKARGSSKATKQFMRQIPANSQRGLFGLNLVKDTDQLVVITEGQFDAMAVYQATGIPSISLPQGATNLHGSLIPFLAQFKKIVLWMDNDEAGRINTPKIAQKLGLNRTFVVKHKYSELKDANDFLRKMPQKIKQLIALAKQLQAFNLADFQLFKSAVYDRIANIDKFQGIKVDWFPFFNKVVKGIRMSELTIMSGPTGSGKTSILSQLSLDLCKNKHTVLWGSFQVRNQILITSMLYQFSGIRLDKHIQQFEYYADRFSQLPLYFMNFYGSTDIQKVLQTIIFAIQTHNAHLVVLDTLQFMISGQGEGFQRFQIQDRLMARLRQISIKYNIHIVIVIHPRKTDDNQDIGIHSIYGTSKATQEADNVWLIQNRDGFKVFDVKKNRHDGQLGRIPLGFNRNIKVFFQLSKLEFEDLRNKERTMAQIIADKQEKQNKQKTMSNDEILQFEEQIDNQKMARKQNSVNFSDSFRKFNSNK